MTPSTNKLVERTNRFGFAPKIARLLSTDVRAFMKTPYSCSTARDLTFTPLNSRSFALISYLCCEHAVSDEWSCEHISSVAIDRLSPMNLGCFPNVSLPSPESKHVVFTSFCARSFALSQPLGIPINKSVYSCIAQDDRKVYSRKAISEQFLYSENFIQSLSLSSSLQLQ